MKPTKQLVARRAAVTIVEIIVVLAIIAMLFAILFPALQQARSGYRRSHCASNIRQFGIAMHSYESSHQVFPAGGTNGFSLHVALLSRLGMKNAFNAVNFSLGARHPSNFTFRTVRLDVFVCPSDSARESTTRRGTRGSNYVGNFGTGVQVNGYDGMFRQFAFGSQIKTADVIDGLSNTAALSEVLVADGSPDPLRVVWYTGDSPSSFDEFREVCLSKWQITRTNNDAWLRGRPWTFGDAGITLYNHIFPPNHSSCFNGGRVQQGSYPATSQHPGGVNLLFSDGRVNSISVDVDADLWRSLGSRNGQERIPVR